MAGSSLEHAVERAQVALRMTYVITYSAVRLVCAIAHCGYSTPARTSLAPGDADRGETASSTRRKHEDAHQNLADRNCRRNYPTGLANLAPRRFEAGPAVNRMLKASAVTSIRAGRGRQEGQEATRARSLKG